MNFRTLRQFYNSLWDAEDEAVRLYETYVKRKAPFQVALDGPTFEELNEVILEKTFNSGMFDTAQVVPTILS